MMYIKTFLAFILGLITPIGIGIYLYNTDINLFWDYTHKVIAVQYVSDVLNGNCRSWYNSNQWHIIPNGHICSFDWQKKLEKFVNE